MPAAAEGDNGDGGGEDDDDDDHDHDSDGHSDGHSDDSDDSGVDTRGDGALDEPARSWTKKAGIPADVLRCTVTVVRLHCDDLS
jgi:hypothetical protein